MSIFSIDYFRSLTMLCDCGGYLIETRENLTCTDCSRIQESTALGELYINRYESSDCTSVACKQHDIAPLDIENILELEGLTFVKSEVLSSMQNLSKFNKNKNITFLTSVYILANRERYFPMSKLLRYSEQSETLTTLNSKISNLCFKANLSIPVPPLNSIIEYSLNHLNFPIKFTSEISTQYTKTAKTLADNRVYTKCEIVLAICLQKRLKLPKTKLKFLCEVLSINFSTFSRAIKKFESLK